MIDLQNERELVSEVHFGDKYFCEVLSTTVKFNEFQSVTISSCRSSLDNVVRR
jgi:hypothetical protein